MDEFIRTFKALSDETRLRILHILTVKGCSEHEIMRALSISQTRASRNLSILVNAGFLKSQRIGSRVYFSLNEEASGNFGPSIRAVVAELAIRSVEMRKDNARMTRMSREWRK
jgi:ArsR family transcriptional regulator